MAFRGRRNKGMPLFAQSKSGMQLGHKLSNNHSQKPKVDLAQSSH
jgi:hypothetical protein